MHAAPCREALSFPLFYASLVPFSLNAPDVVSPTVPLVVSSLLHALVGPAHISVPPPLLAASSPVEGF